MLVESPFSSSVETSLVNVSECANPFAACDWASLAETYQMIHKFPICSQVSFLEALPVPDAMNPKLQVTCPETSTLHTVSEKALTSIVYRRRKWRVKPGGIVEHNIGKSNKQDDSIENSTVSVHDHGESTKRENRFNECLVYRRKKRRGKSSCNLDGETTVRGDGLDDAFASEHDCGETNRRGNQSDNLFVYSRKKDVVKFSSCSFSEHVTGGTKISGYQTDSSASSQRGLIAKADGAFTEPSPGIIKNSGHQPFYSQSKQLVNSIGSINESHIGKTKKNGDRSDVLLMYSRRKKKEESIGDRVNGFLVYSRRKKKEKSIGDQVNGFLVYSRKKFKFRGPFSRHYVSETKKSGDQSPIVSSHTCSVPDKNSDNIYHVEQLRTAVELVDDTELTKVTCSSDGTNDIYSSFKSSSELASSSSTTDTRVSETDTDGDSSPFRQCRHCEKPVTIGKMLICDECEGAYHTSCCGIRTKEVAELDDWVCPSCLKTKSSKTKIKGRTSRERKLRVTEPSVIGIRIGKKFQADVPDWSGPTMSDTSFIGEPLKIDQSEYIHDLKTTKNSKKQCSAVNWLQCREEDANGDICGKWRRAPSSEVQTKDWECFGCVFWDPWHADCAVPQELETSEILQQLKYIKMLRPRSNAKRRKLGAKGRSRPHNKGKS